MEGYSNVSTSKEQKIEAVRISIGRIVLYFLALLINIIAVIVLARKLLPQDYAIFQLATKRIISYATIPLSIFSIWIYRYTVENHESSYYASIFFSLFQASISFIVGLTLLFLYTRVSLLLIVIASLSLSLQAFFRSTRVVVDAARPLKMALLELFYRSFYAFFVFIFVYLISSSLFYAFIATIVSYLLSSSLALFWLKDKISKDRPRNVGRIIMEWIYGSQATTIGVIIGLIPTLDAMVAYPLIGSLIVAAFFIVSSSSTLIKESTNVGLRYLHSYVLRTGDVRTAYKNIEVSLIIVLPFIVYGVMYPKYVIYIYNPIYAWATRALSIFLISAIVEILNNGISQIAMGWVRERGAEATKKFTKMNVFSAVSPLFYISLLFLFFSFFKFLSLSSLLLIWSIIYLLRFVISSIINAVYFLPKEARKYIINELVPKIIVYFLLSLAISYFLRPIGPPSARLLIDAKVLILPSLAEATIFYGVVLAINKSIRNNLISLIKKRSLY